jgi:hypothetical protein
MNTLKQKAKNHRLAFTLVAVLLLLFVSLQGQLNQLYASDAQPAQKDVTAYPATPEGVVEAFVNWRGKFNFVYSYPKNCENLLKYIAGGDAYLDKYCGGGKHILSDFKIIETKTNKDSTEVRIKHSFCGWCANDGSCSVEKSEAIGTYKLSKDKNKWKIKEWYSDGCPFPCDGWMTVDEAIKMNTYFINKGVKHLGSKEELKQLIRQLKQCKEGR